MKYITFIPLIGGMAIANMQATGKKPEFVLSYDAFAKNESNLKNYWPDVDWHLLDAETNQLAEDVELDYSDIDFVSSVCPCAGMSGLNCANRGADNATNNWLYKSAEYILGTIKPKVYFGENAPGLYSEQNVKVLNKLREYGRQYGYAFTIYKTDTYRHGIPQHRMRTFFFFWKGECCPQMDWYNHPSELPFEEWILDKNVGTQTTHLKNYGTTSVYPEMRWIMETRCDNDYSKYVAMFHKLNDENSIRTPYEYIEHNNLWQEYRDWLVNDPNKDKPMHGQGKRTPMYYIDYRWGKVKQGLGYFAPQPIVYKGAANAVISKNMWWTLHPIENRYLTTREIMSLMGLPNDFELITKNLQQVTQNVPVCTAKDMTEQVVKFINGELQMTPYNFIKQNNLQQKIDKIDYKDPDLFEDIIDDDLEDVTFED
jgi:site-specific DNA-cytosine methylase